MLTRLDHLPAGFLDVQARDLHQLLDGPTLIHLGGRRGPELFVSVLQHGNEDVGLAAVQQVLRHHAGHELPRAMTVFVANVAAAREGVRHLPAQPDLNRCWPGTGLAPSPEQDCLAQVHALMRERGVFACVDLHNNTGLNPHYAIVNRLDANSLHLASLFSRTVVYFSGLAGSMTRAFAPLAPTITAECGRPGEPANADEAARLIEACLHMAEFPPHGVRPGDLQVYHTLARVTVREGLSFRFGDPFDEQEAQAPTDVTFDQLLDRRNFRDLEAGEALGHSRHALPLVAIDEQGRDVSTEYFAVVRGRLRLARPTMPAMLSTDAHAVKLGCLCYLMERLPHDRLREKGLLAETGTAPA